MTGGGNLLLDLYRRWIGFVDVAISGMASAELVNLAAAAGMDLWDVRRCEKYLRARIAAADFLLIRPLCRRTRCRMRVVSRHGLPFLRRRLAGRGGLVAGLLLAAVLVIGLAGRIWVIEVRGTAYIDERAVRYAAAQLGLRPGVWKGKVQATEIGVGLPRTLPQLAWGAVRIQGTRAIVEVVERYTITNLSRADRVDLVAGRPCTVRQVVVFAGQRRVKEGETVQWGQVLIEGGIYVRSAPAPVLPGFPRPEPDLLLRTTAASGRVLALCTQVIEYQIPAEREERELTGRRHHYLWVKIGAKSWRLGPANPFTRYRTAAGPTLGQWLPTAWRNRFGPVELRLMTASEEIVMRTPISEAEILAAALRQAEEVLRWRLRPQDRLLHKDAAVVEYHGDLAVVRVTLATLEDIGQPRLIPES